jgi:hypothetical protein
MISSFYNHLSAKKKLLLLVFFSLLLTGCAKLVRTEQPSIVDWATLSEANTVGQTFVAKYDGLSGIYFYLSPQTSGDGQIKLHVRSEPAAENDLAVSVNTLSIKAIKDPGFYDFLIPALPASNQKYYYAFLEMAGSGDVQVGKATGGTYLNGALYQDGTPGDAQAAFQLLYSWRKAILGLGREVITWVGILIASFFLFALPGWGLFSLLWPGWGRLSWAEKLGLSAGMSLGLYPLVLLWTDLIGLHLGAIYAWMPPLAGLGMILWRNRTRLRASVSTRPHWLGFKWANPTLWPDLAFLVILVLLVFTRFWAIRSLEAPQWADSVQHTVMAQLFLDNGGLFKSWVPYAPYNSLTVQFGFPAFAALLAWLTGLTSDKATLIVGQIINILAVLALYPLAVKISKGNRWAGIGAVLVAGLISPMPAFYVNWGRYAQLAGLAELPVSLWLVWEALSPTFDRPVPQKNNKVILGLAIVFSALVLAGMMLSYYRMPFYYATFILALLAGWGFPEWHTNGRQWARKFIVLLAVASLAILLFLPWGIRMIGSNLAGNVQGGLTHNIPLDVVRAEFQGWLGLFSYAPIPLVVGAIAALVWSLIRKHWVVSAQALWLILLSAVIAGKLIRLPGANMMETFAILISIYIPIGLVIGWLVSEIAGPGEGKVRQSLVAIVLSMIAIYGAVGQRAINLPAVFTYVTRPDKLAMTWIKENLPADARFFVEGVMYKETSIIGSDAGWWIPLLAGRQNTMPPQYAVYSEKPITPDYTKHMVTLVKSLQTLSIDSPQFVSMLCSEGVSNIYVGQMQGWSTLAMLGSPQLFSPAALLGSPDYILLYHQDRVFIFGLKPGICR